MSNDKIPMIQNTGAEVVPEWSPTDYSDVKVIIRGNGHGYVRQAVADVITALIADGTISTSIADKIMQKVAELGYKNETQTT